MTRCKGKGDVVFVDVDLKSAYRLCRKIGVKMTRQQIIEASLKFTHKMSNMKKPKQLFKLLRIPRHFRPTSTLAIINPPRMKKCHRSLFYKLMRQFNDLPNHLKYISPKDFKKEIGRQTIREVPDDWKGTNIHINRCTTLLITWWLHTNVLNL